MRKLTGFLFFALLTFSLHSQTLTYRSEPINGVNTFDGTSEKYNTTVNSGAPEKISYAHVTWDAEYIYFAFSGDSYSGNIADNKRVFHIYLDTDPQVNPKTGTGRLVGDNGGFTPTLPFTGNYAYTFVTNDQAGVENRLFKKTANGTGWNSVQDITTANWKSDDHRYWEIAIKRADIGNPTQINMIAYAEETWETGYICAGLPSGLFTPNNNHVPITFNDTFLNFTLDDYVRTNNAKHLINYGWTVGLKAVAGTLTNTTAKAGMFTNATDGLDVDFDIPTPPAAPSNYIEVYFPHTEWSGTLLGPNYIRDYKARADLSATTSTWTFDVKTDKTGDVTISKDVFVNVPENYSIKIKDLSNGTETDLRTSSYTYTIPVSENVRSFELTIGVTLSDPSIVVSPTSLDFGTVKTDASKALGVLITNTGDRALNITDMVVDGSIHYSFEGSTTATLNKNDTTTVFVRFHPKTAGTLTGTLTLTNNDPDNGSLVVNLTGIGQSLSPNISVWVDTLKFGDVVAGTSTDLGFFVANTGDTTLTVSNVVASGTGFNYSGSTSFLVVVNDSNQVTVRFSPATTGDFTGTITITSNDPDTPTKTVQLSGKGTTSSTSKIFAAGWNLMSIPLNPVSNLASDVLTGIPSYLLFKYASGTYQSSTTIDPASGYWLGIETADTVNLTGTPLITDQTKTLAGGWNLIASPFAGGSPKNNLRIIQGSTTYTIDEAVTANLVQSNIYKYNNTSTPAYATVTTLDAWNGHWFFTLASDLSVKYVYALGDASEPKVLPEIEVTPSNWFVDILSEMNGIKDKYLTFGTNELATDGFDNSFDYVKAPISPAANAIESYFLQSGWTNFATRFASNIQAPLLSGVNKTWSFKVFAKSAGSFKLSWLDILNRIPQEIRNAYTFTLRGPGISSGIDMLTQTVYEFNVTAGGTYSFVINSSPVGVEDELMNLNFNLGQNYPNPFNPSTTINYAIKETGLVSLKIYDILGNEVVTLVNDVKQPGQYEVKFEASNLPSGTYIYKLVQGKNSEIKKLMLLK